MAKKDKAGDDVEIDTLEVAAVLERLSRLLRQAGHAEGLMPVQWEALRYLARANRLSNSPGAMARYLGATKGTISQTILTLEKKGLLKKESRLSDVRSVILKLTEAGEAALLKDPLAPLNHDIAELGGKTRRRMARGLSDLLKQEALRQDQPLFGKCADCRYYREGTLDTPHNCMLDQVDLTETEAKKTCAEFTDR
jgi:DNA-binding MarR family transcriptional regulator